MIPNQIRFAFWPWFALAVALTYAPRANVEVKSRAVEKPFRVRFSPGAEPATLSPLTLDGQEALPIHAVTLESLLSPDPETYQWRPGLAEGWGFSADDRAIDFTLRADAKWCDGQPVTADDVKFSFDAIFDPRFQMAFLRPFYATFKSVEVIDPRHVRFHLRQAYFGNLIQSASLKILPAHIYRDHPTDPAHTEALCGSGPYAVERWDHGRSVTLRQNKFWWGRADHYWRHQFLPSRMAFVFVADDARALEMMDRGELDYTELSPETYTRQRRRGRPPSSYEIQEVRNAAPTPVSQVTLNLNDPIFGDPRTRRALNLMVNRDAMITHLYDGAANKAVGPWYRQSPYADAGARALPYDPARALTLLKDAGWRDDGRGEVLTRVENGRRVPLQFTVLVANERDVRVMTMLKEDAARVGVDVRIRRLDANSIYRSLSGRKFQAAVNTDQNRFVDFDPRSEFAARGGANFAGFRSAAADALIGRIATTNAAERRRPLMQNLFKVIAGEVPSIYLLNDDASYYAVSNRVGRPRPFTRFDNGLRSMYLRAEPAR